MDDGVPIHGSLHPSRRSSQGETGLVTARFKHVMVDGRDVSGDTIGRLIGWGLNSGRGGLGLLAYLLSALHPSDRPL